MKKILKSWLLGLSFLTLGLANTGCKKKKQDILIQQQ